MLGREVKTLINQTQDASYRSVIWNATNDYGKPVSAGIYLYQIQAGEYISTKKIMLFNLKTQPQPENGRGTVLCIRPTLILK